MFMRISFRRLTHLIFLSILTVILVSACNTTNNTSMTRQQQLVEDCRTVQHVMGETCIPRNPQRVVNLAADTLASCWALGIRPIASTYPPGFPMPKYLQGKVDRVESVGDYTSPNLEKILSLKPDLIIYDSQYEAQLQETYSRLSKIAPTVVLNIPFPAPPWTEMFEELAQVLDKEDVGQQLINQYWQRVEKLKKDLGDRRQTMEISIANTSSDYGIWSYGQKHHSSAILNDIGLQRPAAQKVDSYYIENISLERIFDIDGDLLFFVSSEREDDKQTLEKLQQDPLWSQLKVVQNDKVYFVGMHWHSSDIFAINAILDDLEKYLVNTP